jgi:hypothetical protein
MDVGSLLIADAKTAKLIEPTKCSFDHPSPSPQTAAVSGVAFGNHRDNVSKSKGYSGRGGVIAPVAQDALRAMTRMSSRSLQWWDRINERERLLRVVSVGPRELNGQRNSLSVANQMPLAAKFGSIGGVRSRLAPPKTARTELLSTTARDQSICPERASQSSKTKWRSCQIPRSCQSRSRRQQLIPEPQPISCGSISQGIPLRRTNTMPVRHALSAKRALPPLGFALATGINGSTSFHNASGKNSTVIGQLLAVEMFPAVPRVAGKLRFC